VPIVRHCQQRLERWSRDVERGRTYHPPYFMSARSLFALEPLARLSDPGDPAISVSIAALTPVVSDFLLPPCKGKRSRLGTAQSQRLSLEPASLHSFSTSYRYITPYFQATAHPKSIVPSPHIPSLPKKHNLAHVLLSSQNIPSVSAFSK
jgi:hypothetical protein